VIGELWDELEPDLAAHGEARLLRPLLDTLLARGTSATRQRRVFAETGNLASVVADAVAVTMRAVPTAGPIAARPSRASQHP
jgi:carboxylate-amine ligase